MNLNDESDDEGRISVPSSKEGPFMCEVIPLLQLWLKINGCD
jgi:hypothetical protein